jgi:hypothetical protein
MKTNFKQIMSPNKQCLIRNKVCQKGKAKFEIGKNCAEFYLGVGFAQFFARVNFAVQLASAHEDFAERAFAQDRAFRVQFVKFAIAIVACSQRFSDESQVGSEFLSLRTLFVYLFRLLPPPDFCGVQKKGIIRNQNRKIFVLENDFL